jgi:hypothetical protein
MPELYQVLEEADRVGQLSAIAQKAPKAEGVDNNRLLAPMDAILLKKENVKQNPEALKQFVVSNLLMQRLALLPQDQSGFILNQLYPGLKLAAVPKQITKQPPKSTQPAKKEESPTEKAKESSSYVGQIIKALAALGVTAATIDAIAGTLVAIASEIFTNVVLRAVVEGSKVHVREAIKKIVEEEVKSPKLRVLTEAARRQLPDAIADELGHVIDEATRSYGAQP